MRDNEASGPCSSLVTLWRSFRSMRTAMIVLVALATFAALGTAVPQNRDEAFYAETYGPTPAAMIHITSFDDVYHSWWFISLLACLLLSLLVCSLSRLVAILRGTPPQSADCHELRQGDLHRSCTVAADDNTTTRIRDWLTRRRYRVSSLHDDTGGCRMVAEKGRIGRYGSLVIHFGTIIVLIGGALSGIWGVTSKVKVKEGQTVDVPGTPLTVQLHDFTVEYHPGSDNVSEYRGTASVLKNGQELVSGVIKVNHPLKAAGFRIYQMNYLADVTSVVVHATRLEDSSTIGQYHLQLGKPFTVPGLDITLLADEFAPDFVFHEGRAGSRSERFNNPAVHLVLTRTNTVVAEKWVFPDFAGSLTGHAEAGLPYGFQLAEYDVVYESGMKVVRDQGRLLVYLGYLVLIIGSFIACYVFHRALDVSVVPRSGEVHIDCIGRRTRNRLDFDLELKALTAFLQPDKPVHTADVTTGGETS